MQHRVKASGVRFMPQTTTVCLVFQMFGSGDKVFDNTLMALRDGKWKYVRQALAPSFSIAKLKQVSRNQTLGESLIKPRPDDAHQLKVTSRHYSPIRLFV